MRHHLDHASTSPLRPVARQAVLDWLDGPAADPSRLHQEALEVRAAVEGAREAVAACFGARPREVVFTSGATESINAATWGATADREHVVCPVVEHAAVRLASARHQPTTVGVDHQGRVDVDELFDTVGPHTALVHLQLANHEVGTRQPVAAAAERARELGVLLHVDAATGAGQEPIEFTASGIDLMSVSAHKLGGPPGVGALLVRRGLRLRPLVVGSDQERARRAGMENVLGIIGFGAACAELAATRALEAAEQRRLTMRLRASLAGCEGVTLLGAPDGVAHITCLAIEGIEPQAVLLGLDRRGVAAHSGSACASEGLEPSPVLEAMGADAHRSLRLSLGWNSTDDDIDAVADAVPTVVEELRSMAGDG